MVTLFDYQTKAIDEVRARFTAGSKSVLLVAPMRAGKTVVAQVTGSVRWTETIEFLVDVEKIELFLELGPGGVLAGHFYFENTPADDGPPWGLAPGELDALLGERFELVHAESAVDSLPIFAGKERWREWRRR